ncbi:MAG: AEC family transporter [Pseudomonadota bacterium]
MIGIFLQTLPFFGVIGLGYGAARVGMFPAAATQALTRYVFYFALSAMLFQFAASLEIADLIQPRFIAAYLLASGVGYGFAMGVARWRGENLQNAAMEAHAAVIGNVGFMGIPMLSILMGPAAAAWVILILALDFILFGSLVVILISIGRSGVLGLGAVGTIAKGLITNPMIVSIALGLAWSASGWTMPGPAQDFLSLLGAGATPGALFAIGASLAGAQLARLAIAGWISVMKVGLHPALAAIAAFVVFDVEPYAASVMVAAAALPVAGNVYILAAHYGITPTRISASILISTLIAVGSVSAIISLVGA